MILCRRPLWMDSEQKKQQSYRLFIQSRCLIADKESIVIG